MQNKNIDGGKPFDWNKASKNYAKYRDIYPEEFYQRIIDLGLCVKGQSVLDLGTGTGVLPRNLYRFGAKFTGIDNSENQIAEARALSKAGGMEIEYRVSSAEEMDFPNGSFDVVTACQCFLYFDAEVVLPRIHAVLKENGRLCILWMAWLPGEDEIANASERLIWRYNPYWSGGGFKRTNIDAGYFEFPRFDMLHYITYDIKIPFTRESWHGRIMACRGIGAANNLTQEQVAAFDREHREMLKAFPERFEVLHHALLVDSVKNGG